MKFNFKNLNLNNEIVDILVEDGIIKKIAKNIKTDNYVDYQKALVLPAFNDPHIHIDSALIGRHDELNNSGTLFEGIELWREKKKIMTEADFIHRTNALFNLYVENGVQNIRAHIDITGDNIERVKWAIKQKEIWKDKINIQLVAFPQDGLLSTKNGKINMEKSIEYGIDILGGIPHYELSTKLGNESIEFILDLAKKNNMMVDMHCDEIDDGNSKFLEHLSAETWLRDMQKQVTASHTTAFSRYNNAYVRKLWTSLKKSKIHFIANPLVNAHLGGRFDEVRPGRGITRVKELIANNINVAFGHDDVQDPWYPLGNANMLQVLFVGIHLAHLMQPNEIKKSIDLITTNSAKLMNIKKYEIKVGNPANFIIFKETNILNIIKNISPVIANIRFGKNILK